MSPAYTAPSARKSRAPRPGRGFFAAAAPCLNRLSSGYYEAMTRWKLATVFLVLFALAGCERPEPAITADQTLRPAKIEQVAGSAKVIEYEFVGRVQALATVDMSFEVSGPLQLLKVLEGQEVAAGAMLAALDPTDFELAVREAAAQLKLAEQDLHRKQQVLARKGIARSVVEDAQTTYDLQRVRLDQARQSLNDSKLYAPFDAYVARRYVDNNVNVRAGEAIVRLHDLSQLLVTLNVPEHLLATASEEQLLDAYAVFDFIPGERFPVRTYENRGEADSVAQTYRVALVMDRPEAWNLLPGMTATILVRLRDPNSQQVAFVPPSALVSAPDGSLFVWLYDPGTHEVTRQRVRAQAPVPEGVPVVEGLAGGEYVVTTGASQLQEGMRVRPMES